MHTHSGVICTPDSLVYLTCQGWIVHTLPLSIQTFMHNYIWFPEYQFKLTLLCNNYKMLHIICTSTLLGQSIITYLQQKGFPEVSFSLDCFFFFLYSSFGMLDWHDWFSRLHYTSFKIKVYDWTSPVNVATYKPRCSSLIAESNLNKIRAGFHIATALC